MCNTIRLNDGQWKYTPGVDEVPRGIKVLCGICGEQTTEFRNMYGPTGFAEAMGKSKHYYDLFECPNANKEWHQQIELLEQEKKKTHSSKIREIIDSEIDEILIYKAPTIDYGENVWKGPKKGE